METRTNYEGVHKKTAPGRGRLGSFGRRLLGRHLAGKTSGDDPAEDCAPQRRSYPGSKRAQGGADGDREDAFEFRRRT